MEHNIPQHVSNQFTFGLYYATLLEFKIASQVDDFVKLIPVFNTIPTNF